MQLHFGSRHWQAVLAATVLAGTIDLAVASLQAMARFAPVPRMLKAIASGLLGAAAFRGGPGTAALGLALHYLLMAGIACAYVALLAETRMARRTPIVAGALFGAAVCLAMDGVVVPLSRAPFHMPLAPWPLLQSMAWHILDVGFPMALVVRRILLRPGHGTEGGGRAPAAG